MSVVTSLISWAENRFIVCSQLINVLATTSSSWDSLISADGTTNSSEELRGQLTLLNKLINNLKDAKQYYETGSSQEVQRELLEFLSDTPPSTKQTQGTMKTFRPSLNCSPGPTPSTKSGDGVDDQRRDEPSCNSSSSTVDEDDVGSDSSYTSSMSTSITPHGTDQCGNCILSQEGEESVWPSWPGPGPDTDMNSRSDHSEASDDTSNLVFGVHRGHSPDFSFCQPQDSGHGSMEGYLFFDNIKEMSFLEVLRSIHTKAPLSLDRYPQTPNITCPLQAKITLSRRRTAYYYKKLAGNLLGMMLEIQMVVSELQSICVDVRTLPESQGQSGAKLSILQQIKEDQHMLLPILQQIEATLSKDEYEFETIFDGIGLRVYILKKYFEKLYSDSEGHSVEFDDIMDFVIDAMMRADNCPILENSVTMDDDLIKTIYAEYQSLSKHDKLLYQFVGFVLIQFVFSDSVAVDAVAQYNGPTSPLPSRQPQPSLTTVAAGAGIGGQPAPWLNPSVSAPLDLYQGGLTSSVEGVFWDNNFTQTPPLPSAGDQVQQQLLPPTTQGQHAASHAGFGDDAVAHNNGQTLTPPLPFLVPRKQPMVCRQPQPSLTTVAAGAGIGGQPAPRLNPSVSAPPALYQGQGGLTSSVGGLFGYNNFTQTPPLPSAGDQVQQQLLPPTTQGQHAASHAAAAYPVQQQQVLAPQQLAPQLACVDVDLVSSIVDVVMTTMATSAMAMYPQVTNDVPGVVFGLHPNQPQMMTTTQPQAMMGVATNNNAPPQTQDGSTVDHTAQLNGLPALQQQQQQGCDR